VGLFAKSAAPEFSEVFVPGNNIPYLVAQTNIVRNSGLQPTTQSAPLANFKETTWAFRLLALALPLLLLAGLECVLRVTLRLSDDVFLTPAHWGEDYYVPNDRFGFRFFPPPLRARRLRSA